MLFRSSSVFSTLCVLIGRSRRAAVMHDPFPGSWSTVPFGSSLRLLVSAGCQITASSMATMDAVANAQLIALVCGDHLVHRRITEATTNFCAYVRFRRMNKNTLPLQIKKTKDSEIQS
eukprot:scpid98006/ scgid11967/ 